MQALAVVETDDVAGDVSTDLLELGFEAASGAGAHGGRVLVSVGVVSPIRVSAGNRPLHNRRIRRDLTVR